MRIDAGRVWTSAFRGEAMGQEKKKLFEASAEAMKHLARKYNIYLPCGCDDAENGNAHDRDKARYRYAVEQIRHLNNIRNNEEYHNVAQQVSKGINYEHHREFMEATGYLKYLEAASAEIYWRQSENAKLGIPVNWDVAHFMGFFVEDALDEYDGWP